MSFLVAVAAAAAVDWLVRCACIPNRFVIAESCRRTLLVSWHEISSTLRESTGQKGKNLCFKIWPVNIVAEYFWGNTCITNDLRYIYRYII